MLGLFRSCNMFILNKVKLGYVGLGQVCQVTSGNIRLGQDMSGQVSRIQVI